MLKNNIEYLSQDREAIKILADFLPDKIFDAHMHLYNSEFLPNVFKNDAHTFTDINAYKEAMTPMLCNPKKLRMNIIPYPADIALMDKNNLKLSDEFLISQLNKSDDNVGEIIVLPHDTEEDIEKRLVHPGIRGLKCYLSFSDDPKPSQSAPEKYLPKSAWEVANKNKLCITLHLALDKSLADPINLGYIKTMAKIYPNAKLILAHCARAFASWTCVEIVHKPAYFDNIFFDFSAICESPSIFQIMKKIGIEKCMWGSDYPVCTGHGKAISIANSFCWISENDLPLFSQKWILGIENLMAVRQAAIMAELKERQIEDIFYTNAIEIFNE